jgi:2,4-dienoyl-CoA reductase-like NADH-dependent reductase (Old Yellow Enzyme family)
MSTLFSPYSLGGLTLSNRIAISPMCQYSADRGEATDWHLMHLGQLALSGAALMITEATAVEPIGRISAHDLGLWDDRTEAALARVVAVIRQHSNMALGMQIGHAGRKASSAVPWEGGKQVSVANGGWQTVAPSAVPHTPGSEPSLPLDEAGLERIRRAFVATAQRAVRLGFELIELHGAHGYLLHQFLSPLSNQRTDDYGGSLENRMRFPLEVFDAVRAAVPTGIPVGIRVSASDWVEGGWDIEQTVVFANALKARGCDFIDVSSGGLSPDQKLVVGPGYQVPFAARVHADTAMPTLAVGLITDAIQAETIVATGQADMVLLARAMLYDSRWPWHAAATLGAQVEAPPQYWRSQPHGLKDLFSPIRPGQKRVENKE